MSLLEPPPRIHHVSWQASGVEDQYALACAECGWIALEINEPFVPSVAMRHEILNNGTPPEWSSQS